jgi:hypothetical protein
MARDERAEREAAVQRIVRGFDARSVDETPFRPAEFLIFSMIVRSAYDKYTNVMGIRPDNLWWVALIEGAQTFYLQQWDPNGLSPGRGVSVRGDEMLVFIGEKEGLRYTRIDVTGHPGPWNAEARVMAGELKRYVGSNDDNVQAVLQADRLEWFRHSTSRLSRFLNDPDAEAPRGRASAADLERAKQIVEGRPANPSRVSSAPEERAQPNQPSGRGGRIPPWVWVVIVLGVLYLLMKGQ